MYMKTAKLLNCLICLFLLVGCNNQVPTPKPMGYNRIDIPHYNYTDYQSEYFNLQYSDLAKIKITSTPSKSDSELWFDISYPAYNAVLHCTYIRLTKGSLSKVLEDNHRLVYSHASMADAIDQQQYLSDVNNVSGILYRIAGDVATPIQFYATDSTTHFIRGSLYYESIAGSEVSKVNLDSVVPVTSMIAKDITHLMETLSWVTHTK